MAYVRKTQTMINDIVENIDRMRDREMENYPNERLHVEGVEKEQVTSMFWKEHPQLMSLMPPKWCETTSQITLKVEYPDGSKEINFGSSTNSKDELFKLPPNMSSWNAKIECALSDLNAGNLASRVADAIVKKDKRLEIRQRFTEIRMQLRKLLEQHNSLNTALKTLPELALYVPQKYINRVNEKEIRERNTQAKTDTTVEELEIDVDKLVATAIASRLN